MSILSDFEDRIAGAVEGIFAGAFRSPVQPVEVAKALSKAMDDGRAVGVGKVYAPVAYTVAMSREDRRNLGEFTNTLEGELATYLVNYAREQGYSLTSKPRVRFDTHNDLHLGRFRVSADLAAPAEDAVAAGAGEPAPVPESAEVPEERAERPAGIPRVVSTSVAPATLTVDDHDVAIGGMRAVIGRVRDCDVCLADVNVSRRHAELVRRGEGWAVRDLDSTNGTFVNGGRVLEAVLHEGDVIEVGATRLVYHAPRSGA